MLRNNDNKQYTYKQNNQTSNNITQRKHIYFKTNTQHKKRTNTQQQHTQQFKTKQANTTHTKHKTKTQQHKTKHNKKP